MIAASITGCVFVPIDPRTRGDKLAFMLKNSGCRGVLCTDYCAQQVVSARPDPKLEWLLVLETGEAGARPMASLGDIQSLNKVLASHADPVEPAPVELTDPLQIIYTSGTTGDPKGIVGDIMRFGGTGLMGGFYGYTQDERPYTGLSLTHNNARPPRCARH